MSRKDRVRQTEAECGALFEAVSHYIFSHPELGGQEEKSCAYLTEVMREQGFQITCPYGGEKTGFRAEYSSTGSGGGANEGPVIAFLAEYDALPGYGEDGGAGHACGHNWIAATTLGAAVVTAKLMEGLPGKVVLLGTPAEETYGGKISMIEHGAFRDIDTAMQVHLDETTESAPSALAMSSTRFGFKGRAAHAAQYPHEGINALDAAQLTFAGINAMRQHVTPDVRIHGIITDGGAAANIVPEHSGCEFFVRAAARATVESVTEKLFNCVKGAALMTGAEWCVEHEDPVFYDIVNVPVLVELAENNLKRNGFDEVHRTTHVPPGSSDVGNVSHVCPTLYMETAMDERIPFLAHDRSVLEYVDSEVAYRTLHRIVCVMAETALELLENPELIKRAKREHAEKIAAAARYAGARR